jgi:hypothetical protein
VVERSGFAQGRSGSLRRRSAVAQPYSFGKTHKRNHPMFSGLVSLIIAFCFGTIIVVGIGIAIQLAQQRDADKRNRSSKSDAPDKREGKG